MPMGTNKTVANGAMQSAASTNQSQDKSSQNPQATTNQHLVKALKVSMQVKDTRKVASTLQSWIASTDIHSVSVGTDYEQVANNLYSINLTFSIQSSLYPRIYNYLRDYSAQNGGHLTSFNETVQDMTSDYVDTQSRVKTLQIEQGRLLDLMSHAQAIGDVIAIEQKLTDVEGQLETYEGQLKNLTNQLSFYTVQIDLEPIDVATPPPADPAWSIGSVVQQAFSASLTFAQLLLTFLIWLLAFAWYAIPVVIVIWLSKRFKLHMPKFSPASALPKTGTK
jgi:hypothetical protein